MIVVKPLVAIVQQLHPLPEAARHSVRGAIKDKACLVALPIPPPPRGNASAAIATARRGAAWRTQRQINSRRDEQARVRREGSDGLARVRRCENTLN